ncbi:Centrosomal protein of 135 kDa [Acipenser ruthenus]|uniref:Centrosomal protein of 135 kDa n=1 Tax=Acipenser ruthenus TaxID=7906 RepID=A0A662YP88_ACIRT|nr:Centrosomal protein of 135 kDa [Acipenser ruthenus]
MDCKNTEKSESQEQERTNNALETQIQHLLESKEDVTGKNERLCKELTEIDKLAEQLEKDKETVVNTADKEIEETKETEFLKINLEKSDEELKANAEENKNLHGLLDQLQTEKEKLSKKVEKLGVSEKELILEAERVPGHLKRKDKSPSRLDSFVKTLEEDRDHYKREVQNLRKMLKGRNSSPVRSKSRGRSPSRSMPVKGGTYDSEVMRIMHERDELKAMLEKYERHMAEIQGNIKVLTADRDQANILHEQAREEITRLRREIIKSTKTPKSSLAAHSILRRVEAERDQATADLRRMTTERDSLRERLQISHETAINERAHLEQRTEDLQSEIILLDKERQEYRSRQSMMKEALLSLEEEVKLLTRKAADTEDDLDRTGTECSILRATNKQMEQTLNENQHRLSVKINELEVSQEKLKRMEEKNDFQAVQIASLREEILNLQSIITSLDQDKDSLQETVDTKTELISACQSEIEEKENFIKDLKISIEKMETTAKKLNETVSSREREISSVRQELDSVNEELAKTGRAKEAAVRECSQLQDALSKARLENQDKENRELLDNYCRAVSQSENWESKAHKMEGEVSSVRLELLTSESERRRLKENIETLERDLDESLVAEDACKSQISHLNKSIMRLEDELRQTQSQKASVFSDLESTRELCIKLDTSKEMTSRQLSSKNLEMEQVLNELESKCSEIELLKKQLASERLSMKNLESLLVTNREKEYHSQMTTQEKLSEIELLRDKLTLADSKILNQSREVAQVRSKSAQLEAELELTNRQLSTERFERQVERAVKELRRHGLSASLSSTSPPRRSLSPRAAYLPERSFLRSPERSLDRSFDSCEVIAQLKNPGQVAASTVNLRTGPTVENALNPLGHALLLSLMESENHIVATGLMDSKMGEAEGCSEDFTGKKKSKFKAFKIRLFGKRKRKEGDTSASKGGLKQSQSASDVMAPESMAVISDSEDELGCPKGVLGSRALSHDSIFIPEAMPESSIPARVLSQENVSGKIKALQLKLQQNIRLGPPPLVIPGKRTEDTGASSEDDGLPRSPPEISPLHESLARGSAAQAKKGTPTKSMSEVTKETAAVAKPAWINMARLKQRGYQEQHNSTSKEEKYLIPEVKTDKVKQGEAKQETLRPQSEVWVDRVPSPTQQRAALDHRQDVKMEWKQPQPTQTTALPTPVQYIVYKTLRSFVESHCTEKLIAYQREFHALKQRLRAAEHRTLQRSSELNTILEQFRRAIAETNGSKDALGHFSVSIVMGIPTVKRKVKSYLAETLHSLINKLSPEEKLDCVIIVFVGEADIDYVRSVVESLEKELSAVYLLQDYRYVLFFTNKRAACVVV